MSPSRSRQQFVPSRPRAEVFTAIAVGVGIVLATALVIWLIRPGTPGVPGGGGLLSRQPRMTVLVLSTVAALAGVVAYATRRRPPARLGARGAIAVGAAVVIVLAVLGGIFWPGSVIRHWPKQPKVTTPVTTPATTPASIVTPPTTVKSSTKTTVKSQTTVAPTTVTPTTVTPTSVTPTT